MQSVLEYTISKRLIFQTHDRPTYEFMAWLPNIKENWDKKGPNQFLYGSLLLVLNSPAKVNIVFLFPLWTYNYLLLVAYSYFKYFTWLISHYLKRYFIHVQLELYVKSKDEISSQLALKMYTVNNQIDLSYSSRLFHSHCDTCKR